MTTRAGAMPHDRHAERSTLAAGIHSAAHHYDVRLVVSPTDYWFPQHQAISAALDVLHDIGPYPWGTHDQWAELHPQTPPMSLNVRIAAVWTLVDDVPLWILRRIAECADGAHPAAASTVQRRASEREEVAALIARVTDLTGAS